MKVFSYLGGAVVAGGVGGLIWAFTTFYTQHEIGWIAWGVGVLAGFCVRMVAQQEANTLSGVIAAVGATGGVILGKYLSIVWLVQKLGGPALDAPIFEILTSSLHPMDLLFFGLAIVTAYRLGSSPPEESAGSAA